MKYLFVIITLLLSTQSNAQYHNHRLCPMGDTTLLEKYIKDSVVFSEIVKASNTQKDSLKYDSVTGGSVISGKRINYTDMKTNNIDTTYNSRNPTVGFYYNTNLVSFHITDEYLEAIVKELARHGYYLLKVGGSPTDKFNVKGAGVIIDDKIIIKQ